MSKTLQEKNNIFHIQISKKAYDDLKNDHIWPSIYNVWCKQQFILLLKSTPNDNHSHNYISAGTCRCLTLQNNSCMACNLIHGLTWSKLVLKLCHRRRSLDTSRIPRRCTKELHQLHPSVEETIYSQVKSIEGWRQLSFFIS